MREMARATQKVDRGTIVRVSEHHKMEVSTCGD